VGACVGKVASWTGLQALGVGGVLGVEVGGEVAGGLAGAAVGGLVGAGEAGGIAGHAEVRIIGEAVLRLAGSIACSSAENEGVVADAAVVFGRVEAVSAVGIAGLASVGSHIAIISREAYLEAGAAQEEAALGPAGLALGAVVWGVGAVVALDEAGGAVGGAGVVEVARTGLVAEVGGIHPHVAGSVVAAVAVALVGALVATGGAGVAGRGAHVFVGAGWAVGHAGVDVSSGVVEEEGAAGHVAGGAVGGREVAGQAGKGAADTDVGG